MIKKIILLPFSILRMLLGVGLRCIGLLTGAIMGMFHFVFGRIFGSIFGALAGLLLGGKHVGIRVFPRHKKK
jgi:hypothetical protein